jgi:hypothetical protein
VTFDFEYATRDDQFFNYALWPYTPAIPVEGKARSANLLFESFLASGVDDRLFPLVTLIRQSVGLSHTVWGVKQVGSQTRWEFYFYDYRRRERTRSMTSVIEAVKPLVPCTVVPNENIFYFMFSIDISEALVTGSRNLDEIHLYVGNPGSTVSSGICYSLTPERMKLENLYSFFDTQTQLQDAASKIACSVHVDTTKIPLDRILWPELRSCRTICIANKQGNDCVYFAGITLDQFLFFLRKLDYRQDLIRFLEENRPKFDHLEYDVGFDYRADGRDLLILKSGYYGTF